MVRWTTASGREAPDDPLLTEPPPHGNVGLHVIAFLAAQGGLLDALPDGRRGRPLTASSQKSGAGIGHSLAAGDGLVKG